MSNPSPILKLPTIVFFAVTMVLMVVAPAAHAQSPPAEALFVRASVDNNLPYLGQQITYTLRIYQQDGADLSSVRVRYSPPDFAGFWNSQQAIQVEYEETIGSNEYRVVEVRTALFAGVVGARDIEPVVLEISADAPGLLERLESPAVAVEVRSLPTPEPVGFTGAVGRFEISSSADAAEGKLNEPVLLTLRISGEGNIDALPDPDWPEFDSWRVIESPVSIERQVVAGQITGSRTYEMLLMPEQAGGLAIPEIRYPYFNPALERYVELTTRPIAVSIADAAGSTTIPSLPAVEEAKEEDPIARPIKAVPPTIRQGGTELTDSAVYWAAWVVPALAIAGAVAWQRRRASQEAAHGVARANAALASGRELLRRATASGGDPRVAASEAVLSYLSARLETHVNGLTREALLRTLRESGVSSDLEDRVNQVLTEGESARYMPSARGSGTGDHADRTSQLLGELEEALTA